MNIETKFAIGDKVWLLQNNKAVEMDVRSISVSQGTVSASGLRIMYCGEGKNDKLITAKEEDCFFSKAALLDYIASE